MAKTRTNFKSVKRRNKTYKKRYSKVRKGGSNIGANCTDPNYSIYNTNLLKMFPYKA
jgi:hypothetical protein